MGAKFASVALSLPILGLLMMAAPAFAQQPAKTSVPAAVAKVVRAPVQHKASAGISATAMPAALAAIPEAQRLAVQADVVWFGDFQGMSAEEVDAHTMDAIRAFQRRNSGRETGTLNDQERALLAETARSRRAAVGWRWIDDTATGARLGIPEKLVPHASAARTGSRWTSGQGQIQIETFRLHEASLPALFDDEKRTAQRHVASSALNPNSFVIIGEQRLKKFIVRAQSSGSEVRGVTILYDQATEGTMVPVAIAVSDTFDGFPDLTTASATRRRGVEYGTAIVATSRGDLVAPADVTDQCQSITVPGFGHADRIAADNSNNLALLRIYGARNLAPATLTGNGATDSALKVFGIADPLAQAGGAGVSSTAAQITPQGLDPVPKPGFSGAAAIDSQGRFAGMVTLKSPTVAGAGSITQQATLVPADAVRAFLAAQHIAAADGHGTIGQSVVRVICVRQ
jgi:hypothetical protein